MSIGAGQWYVRMRGRVLGPFSPSQLASLRHRGRLTEDHELSQDRRSWIKAAEMPGAFAKSAETQSQPQPHLQPTRAVELEWPVLSVVDEPAPAQVSPAAPVEVQWFVARGDSHQGPMSRADVERMINTGELGPSSLVWKQGMPTWQPAAQVNEFRFESTAEGSAAGPPGGAAGASFQAAGANPNVYLPPTSGMAIAGLVLGLLWLCGIGSLLATIFGAMALAQISRSNGAVSGKGLATAGFILGILGLCLSTIVMIIALLFRTSVPNS
jgi:GYF domain 2/Domain of unknown function (DUF4190)